MATYAAQLPDLDSDLIDGLKGRDDSAFHTLFSRFEDRIYRTALRILKEEEAARDALQETMINIFRAASTFRGEAKLGTWINRITINVCLEMIRKNRKHSQRTDNDVSEHLALEDPKSRNPFQSAYQAEVSGRVRTALNRISPKHSRVVKMHDLQGYTIREIAEIEAVAEGTIKSRLFYGREHLKRQLAA